MIFPFITCADPEDVLDIDARGIGEEGDSMELDFNEITFN